MHKMDLTGKVAIITGASSGIGAETAELFASFGASLTLVGRDEARLLKTVNKCVASNCLVPLWLKLDLTHPGSCETVVNKTVELYERIDILVNCAGKVMLSSPFGNSMEVFDELLNINVRVPHYLSQLSMPYLEKTKGSIINVVSSMPKRPIPGLMSYTASKAALQVFSTHVALAAAAKGVRVNCVCPGRTTNDAFRDVELDENIRSKLGQVMPNGKTMDPKEVAILICMTASYVFPNLTGAELPLDGASSWA
ncbi:uncharacterized protein LOC113505574 [Trichoplusia ni]|uniref:Uncharacterized protein LOC113505574 n=1 Tax=Trichoplusia ni TaxID=7111 RepID=A0A7E5WTL2_TRINI|nr:uncharacterized protein LOC113505574 [Trichoplusia ni]